MIETLQIVGFLMCGFLSPIFAIITWKIFRCPDSLWKEMQQTPYNKSHDVYERFWNG